LAVAAWAVGGAVRDALIGREVLDTDATVSGRLDRVARALEDDGIGRAVLLSEDAPRAIRIAGRRTLDLVEAEGGSIASDLARRDFTVNAMALDLATGEFLDPHGGRADLRRRRLRVIADRNLAEDPLRALRAARFIATHGLTPDAATGRACRRHAAGIADAAPERITVELRRILEASRAVPALRWAAAHGVLAPSLRLPLDAGGVRRVARRLAPLDAPGLRRLAPDRRAVVRLAVLSAALDLSPAASMAWLRELRHSRELVGEVGRLRALAEAAGRARGVDANWLWVHDAGALWREALLLFVIRHPGRAPHARRLASRARRGLRRPRVRGGDVLRWSGLPAGPRIGTLLRELEVEILRGRVKTRAQARKWAKSAPPPTFGS